MKQFLTDDQKEKFTKVVIKEDIMDETVGFGAEMYRKGYVDGIVQILIGAACAGYILKRHLDKKKAKERANFDEEES